MVTPELYVRVNHVLKPIRTASFGSFHLGSNAGEIRLNKALTEAWQRRLDVDEPAPAPERVPVSPRRITARSGERCPHSGRWATLSGDQQEYIHMKAGALMPEATKYQSNLYAPELRIPAVWTLLERDDKGSAYLTPEENK